MKKEKFSLENEAMSPEERKKWRGLADEIESVTEGDNRIIQKLTDSLRRGFPDAAQTLCNNEFDKFGEYREKVVKILIKKLFSGSGSPWASIEAKMQKEK